MKLLHTTIRRSQKVLHVLPIRSDSKSIDVLLVFRNYVQYIQIANDGVPMNALAIYPLSVPIVWCARFGDFVGAVTSDAHFLLFNPEPPFNPISNHQLTSKISPSRIPIAHIMPSLRNIFLVCCGYSRYCVILQNIDSGIVQTTIKIPKQNTILSICQTSEDNIFAFLVMKNEGRYVVFVDISNQNYTQIKEYAVFNNTYLIVSVNEGNNILLFSKAAISILDSDFSMTSPQIASYFAATQNYFIFQTIEGKMIGLDTINFKSFEHGKMPLISQFSLISPNVLFCISENGNSFFIPFPNSGIEKLVFDKIENHSLTFYPRVIGAIFNHRHLIVISGQGEQSCMTQISNSLKYTSQKVANVQIYIPMRIFCVDNGDTIVGSSPEQSNMILGSLDNPISMYPTIRCGKNRDNDFFQIHTHGVRDLSTGKEWLTASEEEIVTTGAIGDNSIFLSLKNGRCIVLKSSDNFEIVADKAIGLIYDATYSADLIVIATKTSLSTGNEHSTIVIYSTDLNPGDSEAHLPSPVCSMLYNNSTTELYVSTQDGNVYKYILNAQDFADTKTNIYSNTSGAIPVIYPLMDCVLIVTERVFAYNGQQLLALNATETAPIAVATIGNTVYVLDSKGDVSRIELSDFECDLTTKTVVLLSTPRRVMNLDDATIAISRSINKNIYKNAFNGNTSDVSSYLGILKNDNIKHVQLDEKIGALSLLRIPDRPQFIIGCQKQEGDETQYYLNIMQYDEKEVMAKTIQQIKVPASPNAMAYIDGIVLVATGRKILPMSNDGVQWTINQSSLASLHTQVGFIEVSDNFIWVGDRTQSLICFIFSKSDENPAKSSSLKLVPVAIDTEPKQLTAVCVLDRETVAVGDKFGTITILKLPDDVIANCPWRMSLPPDRGVFMPTSGHLLKIASYNIGETITSLIRSEHSGSAAIFYTSLLGQIGALVPTANDDDYAHLVMAENLAKAQWQKEFGMMKLKRFEHLCNGVVGLDLIELIDQLSEEAHFQINGALEANQKVSIQQIVGILGKYKSMCKF